MKRLIIIISLTLIFQAKIFAQGLHGQEPEKPQQGIVFKEMVYNFKEVEYGSDVSHSFFVTNNSNTNMVIKDVQPSCACTITEFTKGPILPGKSGTVSIKYDSSREGNFSKNVTVIINDETFNLTFFGTVKKAPKETVITPGK